MFESVALPNRLQSAATRIYGTADSAEAYAAEWAHHAALEELAQMALLMPSACEHRPPGRTWLLRSGVRV